MKPVTAEWVAKAEEDYVAAAYLSRKRKSSVPGIVCFHCQQCAEKYLKARLVEAGVSFPKTHNLTALLKLVLPVEPSLGALQGKLTPLNHYAVEFRYPGDISTREDARAAFANCGFVRKQIRKLLGLDKPSSTQMSLGIKEHGHGIRRGARKSDRVKQASLGARTGVE